MARYEIQSLTYCNDGVIFVNYYTGFKSRTKRVYVDNMVADDGRKVQSITDYIEFEDEEEDENND